MDLYFDSELISLAAKIFHHAAIVPMLTAPLALPALFPLILLIVFQKVEATSLEDFYGLTSDTQKNTESGYILFYQSRE